MFFNLLSPSFGAWFLVSFFIFAIILLRKRDPRLKTFFMLHSTEHEMFMLIDVKMPTIVGILTFISMINITFENLKARKVYIFQHFRF